MARAAGAPWRRNTLIDIAIGGGTGLAIAGFSDCRATKTTCGGTRAAGVAGSALVGAGIGAVIGAKLRTTLLLHMAPEIAPPLSSTPVKIARLIPARASV
jgi:hypothetical protein